MFAMIFGIVSAALSAFSSFSQSMQQGAAQRQQAKLMSANAAATRQNAELAASAAESEAQERERQKSRLRREYEELSAHNRLALGAGNVDMSTGSALDLAYGNAATFGADMADNAYAAAMTRWQGREQRRLENYRASVMDANASYLNRTAANIGSSLLTSGIAGLGGFAQGYSLAGGSLKQLFTGTR